MRESWPESKAPPSVKCSWAGERTAATCLQPALEGSELAAGAQTKTASCALAPARPLKLSFMFSEHSNCNLGCFSVLVTCPEETDGPGGTWGREATSEKGVSGALRLQGAVGAGAVCSPPACLCGKSGSGRRVLGHGSP